MDKDKIITSIGNVEELKKAVLLINNLQDNYNKIISTDDAKEQAFLCQVCIKLLEMSKEIIIKYEKNFCELFSNMNAALNKNQTGLVDDYVKNILIKSNEIFGIECEYEDICIGETNIYSINTNDTVKWELTEDTNGLTITKNEGNECYVECKYDTKLFDKKETLTATVNGKKYSKEIVIVSLAK